MQTARTTPKGEFAVGVESPNWIDTFPFWFGNTDPASLSVGIPQVGATVRYGITERLDVGAHAGVFIIPHIDIKYRYLGTNSSPWAASLGAVVGSAGDPTAFLTHVTSYHPKENLAFYGALLGGYNTYGIADFVQGNVGAQFGSDWRISTEVGYMVRISNENVLLTYGIGVSRNLSSFGRKKK
ncbi:MAG TPA: hypothetical protein DCR93_10740 [Cytophagales bacterium]|nr:hypothetical protein [Cytophagales bacterium]